MTEFDGKRVTVMGLGRFGGGAGVTRWLAQQGAQVLVTDMQPAETLRDSTESLRDLISAGVVQLRLGGHDVRDFTGCDLLVANPAVPRPWENPFITAAHHHGVPVTTEIRLMCERINRLRVIGITGSAGKSTTSAMIHHLLMKCGVTAHLGGNIGGSLLNQLHAIRSDDWVVLELSSAMLWWLGHEAIGGVLMQGWSPHVAVLTNITPNHIDWHGSFAHYRTSKQNIFRFQAPGDHQVESERLPSSCNEVQIALRVPGQHNQRNARTALVAGALALGFHDDLRAWMDAHRTSLHDFNGLPHRLQLVHECNGVRFYNDSKSTTPEATVLAVQAFDEPARVHLIAGGYDKGSDLSPIAALSQRIAGLYTVGATGPALANAARGFAQSCTTLDAAVHSAVSRLKPGDVLLLSPGCASWDQFTNYEQRGERFVQIVKSVIGVAAAATVKT